MWFAKPFNLCVLQTACPIQRLPTMCATKAVSLYISFTHGTKRNLAQPDTRSPSIASQPVCRFRVLSVQKATCKVARILCNCAPFPFFLEFAPNSKEGKVRVRAVPGIIPRRRLRHQLNTSSLLDEVFFSSMTLSKHRNVWTIGFTTFLFTAAAMVWR